MAFSTPSSIKAAASVIVAAACFSGRLLNAADLPHEQRRPNILFAVADDWSYGHAGAYGCRWVKTPSFDRVATDGILFTHTYTPNAKCSPSRACILTGRNSWQLKAACNHYCFFPPEFPSFVETLKAHGYFVGCTGKGWAPGVANDFQGRPRNMTGQPFNKRQAEAPTSGIAANDYAANFAAFLDQSSKDKPWCFWYGCHEPHRRYEYESGVQKGGKNLADIDRVPGCWPDNDVVRNDMLDYAFEAEHFDKHLGRMLELLERRGELNNTLVVVTSDNGMPFPHDKGQAYDNSNHLPLAIMWKQGIRGRGRVVADYVSFIDFAPTFLEVAGIPWENTGMAPSPGRSLCDIFAVDKSGRVNPQRNFVLLAKERTDVGRPHDQGYPIRGIVEADWLYLRNFEPSRWPSGNPETGYLDVDGSPTKTEVLKDRGDPERKRCWQASFGKRPAEELYALKKDPECLTNLAEQPEWQERRTQMRERLFAKLTSQNDPRMFGRGSVFEEYPYSDPKFRGYYERFQAGEKIRANWVNPSDFEK